MEDKELKSQCGHWVVSSASVSQLDPAEALKRCHALGLRLPFLPLSRSLWMPLWLRYSVHRDRRDAVSQRWSRRDQEEGHAARTAIYLELLRLKSDKAGHSGLYLHTPCTTDGSKDNKESITGVAFPT